jgi:quercetin dioxygenase-like cupin family protein
MIAVCLTVLVASASAQDPVKVDPQHYKVESENAHVRILRVNYGPHEKSPMHDHPDSVAVFLTDGHVKFTIEGGKTNEQTFKAGEARLTPGGKHAPENLSDQPFELILIELKNQAQTPSSPSNLSGVVR